MEEIIFNETLMQHFEKQNSVGLVELLMFGDRLYQYFDSTHLLDMTFKHVLDVIKKTNKVEIFDVPAKDFVKFISYDDFKARRGVSDAMALSLRLFLLHQCGVDWKKPGKLVTGF